jgi:metal-responsive CopG/Arc/MetJ family transcriptional regulator
MNLDANPAYTTVALPTELVEIIDQVIAIKEYGFASRAELVKSAVREYLRKFDGFSYKKS